MNPDNQTTTPINQTPTTSPTGATTEQQPTTPSLTQQPVTQEVLKPKNNILPFLIILFILIGLVAGGYWTYKNHNIKPGEKPQPTIAATEIFNPKSNSVLDLQQNQRQRFSAGIYNGKKYSIEYSVNPQDPFYVVIDTNSGKEELIPTSYPTYILEHKFLLNKSQYIIINTKADGPEYHGLVFDTVNNNFVTWNKIMELPSDIFCTTTSYESIIIGDTIILKCSNSNSNHYIYSFNLKSNESKQLLSLPGNQTFSCVDSTYIEQNQNQIIVDIYEINKNYVCEEKIETKSFIIN